MPPPSRARIRTPAVGGLSLKALVLLWKHKMHSVKWNVHGSLLSFLPYIWIQMSQNECPHFSTFSGILARQQKQITFERKLGHIVLNVSKCCRCKAAAVSRPSLI